MERAATATADLPRMTEKQFSRAKKLLRRLCANYDRGNCLLLEDGYDPCPCPQLISNTLLCRDFRDAVLPADAELWTEIMDRNTRQHCILCGRPIFRSSNAAKYCVNCAAKERRRKDTARKRKRRLDVRKSSL